jgi:hypothetical protein
MDIRRMIRPGIAAALVCGGLVALDSLAPSTGVLVTPANAAMGIRAVKSVCEWNDIEWKELTAAERAAWVTLGWRPETWGSDDPSVEPDSLSKDWTELTANERQAAQMLGYNQQNWSVDPDPCDAVKP